MERAHITECLPADFTVECHGFTLDMDQLVGMSPAALAYLVGNGFTQSLTDAAAFSRSDKEGKSESEIADMARAARQKRFNAIIDGTVGSSGPRGPRRRGIDAVMAEIAEAAIRQAPKIVSGEVKWPEGKGAAATIAGWVRAYIAKNESTVRAEAERRMAAMPAVEFDPTDL